MGVWLFLLGLLFSLQVFSQESVSSLAAQNNLPQQTQVPFAASQENPCQHQPGQSPEMVVIQGGDFLMGSPEIETDRSNTEGPQHRVWVQPFAMGRCEVTVAEFSLFVEETGYQLEDGCNTWNEEKTTYEENSAANWQNPGFKQSDQEPVSCINWTDARAFALWLRLRTGVDYRLPTEAEWEYATRAGTTTPFSTGDCIGAAQANFISTLAYGNCPEETLYLQKTTPVGNYPANPFGLLDMHGNLWEWAQDCWHENYEGAPENGAAWLREGGGDCTNRVLRGGSWGSNARGLRSAYRFWFGTNDRDNVIGFRLARTLPTEPMPWGQSAAAE